MILSDDEEDEVIVKPKTARRLKSDLIDDELDQERSVRAMMDVDDCMFPVFSPALEFLTIHIIAEVVRASRSHVSPPKEEEIEEEDDAKPITSKSLSQPKQDDDIDMDDDSDPAPKTKPRKRREKKVIPIGRNGYKKKRVMKSRMKMDEKGYMGEFLFLRTGSDLLTDS